MSCRFCEETDIHIPCNLKISGGVQVFADLRYDADEAEFDIEFGLLDNDGKVFKRPDGTEYGLAWSRALKINYCPMCGDKIYDDLEPRIEEKDYGI